MKKIIIVLSFFVATTIISFAATGFEYFPDNDTLGLWHFNEDQGDTVRDASNNRIESIIEGKAKWQKGADWNAEDQGGNAFVFDGNTVISIPSKEKIVQPKNQITVEAWVLPEDLGGWKLICAHWGGAIVGSYHLGVEGGVPKFHINTDKGVGFAAMGGQLKLNKWQHVAGTYDGKSIRIFIDGKELGKTNHTGKLKSGDANFDVVIASKHNRQFKWKGSIDEVRISDIARQAGELSPNLDAPQSVEFADQLPIFWGEEKQNY